MASLTPGASVDQHPDGERVDAHVPRNGAERRYPERAQRLAYSPAEAAEALGASRAWVYLRLEDNSIPSVKIGGRRFIRAAVLDALLAGEGGGDDAA